MRAIALAWFLVVAGPAVALEEPRTRLTDPYSSVMWDYLQVNLYGDPEEIAFDDRVVVAAPKRAEDSLHVPVLVDATSLGDVRSITVSVDFGPIPKILTYYPGEAQPKLGFRFKIDQSTPLRAVVETGDGRFYVGSTYVQAVGGGCSLPAAAYASDGWEERLGEVHGRVWPQAGRVRFKVSHPMDTGLAPGIPVFIIEDLALSTPDGDELARVEVFEPVEEDPVMTFYFGENVLPGTLAVSGRDNNGNVIGATIRQVLTQ